MALTQNEYTGDGSTVLYSFTFPYLEVTDIKVSLDTVLTTEYTFANATTILFNTAPGNGVKIRIYRKTNDEALYATFFPGSSIRAQDLNDNFNQNLYVTQESSRDAGNSVDDATEALAKANTAISTANTALADSATAISTANDAGIDSAAAVVTANAANAKADTAITTSNVAGLKAQQALDTVGNALQYLSVPNVAAIPVAPNDNDAVEVFDSTGIESFTPLANKPVGFVGDLGLSVRIIYSAVGSTWNWIRYFANDPESRYLGSNNIGVTVQPYDANLPAGSTILVDGDIGVTVQPYDANLPTGSTILVDGDIGVTVQAYDADTAKYDATTANFTGTLQNSGSNVVVDADIGVTVQAYDADTAKTDVAQTFTAVQTLTDPAIVGTILEDVYTITDGAAFEVDPSNGSVQLITLGANRTPKATNFAAGEAVTLMVADGTAYTLTWTDTTWGTSGVVWTGGSAPTLAASGYTVIQFWKVGSQVYGATVGDVA